MAQVGADPKIQGPVPCQASTSVSNETCPGGQPGGTRILRIDRQRHHPLTHTVTAKVPAEPVVGQHASGIEVPGPDGVDHVDGHLKGGPDIEVVIGGDVDELNSTHLGLLSVSKH